MRFTLATVAALAASVVAAPVESLEKRQADIDATILNFALTLEHLENVFYKGALSKWSVTDFTDAGFSAAYYDNLKYIAHDEEAHVELLTSALTAAGAQPVAACTYKFPYTDVKSFVGLASALEGVGTSAYLGAAPLVTSKAYLTVAGSILVTEALHTSIQRFNLGEIAPANPYGTPLSPNPVYTLAAAFITGCPSSNVALPFKAFPSLTATQGQPTAPGITFTYSTTMVPTGTFFVCYISGLDTTCEAATYSGGMVHSTISPDASGQTYALLTNANMTSSPVSTLNDTMILAGPAILEVTPNSPTFDLSVQ